MSLSIGRDPVSWTPSERRIRCPRWQPPRQFDDSNGRWNFGPNLTQHLENRRPSGISPDAMGRSIGSSRPGRSPLFAARAANGCPEALLTCPPQTGPDPALGSWAEVGGGIAVEDIGRIGPHFAKKLVTAFWRGGLRCDRERPRAVEHARWHRLRRVERITDGTGDAGQLILDPGAAGGSGTACIASVSSRERWRFRNPGSFLSRRS